MTTAADLLLHRRRVTARARKRLPLSPEAQARALEARAQAATLAPRVIRHDVDTDPAARRALRARIAAKLAARKRAPRSPARPAPPSGVTLALARVLRDVSRAMDAAILAELRAQGLRLDAVDVDVDALLDKVTRRFGSLLASPAVRRRLVLVGGRASRLTREQLAAQLRAAIGVPLDADPDVAPLLARFQAVALDRCRSLGGEKLARARAILREAGPTARVEVLAQRLAESAEVTASRAMLIARTETTTLLSRLTRARHEAAGIADFRWSTSRDARTRKSHAELEGKVFAYDAPPLVDGEPTLPGQTYNCRCVAIPVWPTP